MAWYIGNEGLSGVHLLALFDFTAFVSTAGYGAIFVLCVLQSCCVPTSSELTMAFAGALAAQGHLSLAGVIAVGVLGEVVGAYIAWVVGRYAGRAAVDRFGRYVLLTHHDLDRAEDWYDRHQRFGVFGSRLLPVVRNFVALPAGIAEVPLVRFGMLTAAGSFLWDGAWALIGYGVGSRWHTIASGIGDVGYVLAVLGVGVIAYAAYHRYVRYKEATSEGGASRPATAVAGGPRHAKGARAARPAETYGSSRSTLPSRVDGGVGTVRLIARSSGQPPEPLTADDAGTGAVRWIAGSSGQTVARPRRSDFPHSPIAAWEAAVLHRRTEVPARAEPLLGEDGEGVEANGRLTAMLGAILLVLLAIEGLTILRVHSLLTPHVVIGMVLVPVILLKIGSTTWRFARYYLGSPEYRRKGPPPAVLRLLGPFVVVSTVAVVGSGIALLLAPTNLRNGLLEVHKVTFVLWFAAMVVHVLGHLLDVTHLAPRDFYARTRRQVRGAGLRQWAIVSAVGIGIIVAAVMAPKVGPWLTRGGQAPSNGGTTHAAVTPPASSQTASSSSSSSNKRP